MQMPLWESTTDQPRQCLWGPWDIEQDQVQGVPRLCSGETPTGALPAALSKLGCCQVSLLMAVGLELKVPSTQSIL